MKTYSTQQAAEQAGVHRVTLQHWLASKKVRPTVAVPLDGRTLWRWTTKDIKKLIAYKAKYYGKGKGRKPKYRR